LDNKKFLIKALFNIVYTDALANMYYATAIRELNKGETLQLADKYLQSIENGTTPLNKDAILDSLSEAVVDFNALETNDRIYPKVGIVGEIYVKYNSFSMNYIADWLMAQEIEVVIPPLTEFFSGSFITHPEGVKANINKPSIQLFIAAWADRYLQGFLDDVDEIMKGFRYYQPIHSIHSIAEQAQKSLSLTHQYGEGWLIAGEIGTLVKEGVQDVLCLQPFGCIANHVVAKGVGTRLKENYPQLNLLFLDLDAGVSEVNLFNRLHFFINHAKTTNNRISLVEEAALLH
jgi:predicted nucleotide-binding protein (sugar kinase/HSP70/actin superfamily)